MQEFNGKGGAPGSGSVEVDTKRQMQAWNDVYPHEDFCVCLHWYKSWLMVVWPTTVSFASLFPGCLQWFVSIREWHCWNFPLHLKNEINQLISVCASAFSCGVPIFVQVLITIIGTHRKVLAYSLITTTTFILFYSIYCEDKICNHCA